jgi:hypothetical protein
VTANQALRLHCEGDKGAEINQAEETQEQERGQRVLRRAVVAPPQPQADAISATAVRGGDTVGPLAQGRKARQRAVQPQPNALARGVTQDEKAGFGARGALTVGTQILNGVLKVGRRNLRMLRGHLLKRPIGDLLSGQQLPVAHPVIAEATVAVVDQQRSPIGSRDGCASGGHSFHA